MGTKEELRFDVIIVGGGPAGLMAAIGSATEGARTLLLDKGEKLGRKLGISGGGRCNVTNAKPLRELIQNIPGNGRFVYSALTRFSNEDIAMFFEGLGIRLKEEDRGRMFPVSDKASTVVQALVNKVYDMGVEVWTNHAVSGLLLSDGQVHGVQLKGRNQPMYAPCVVVATGGCSVPKTGSTGDAYPWAREAGHTIVEPYPTEVPLTSPAPFIRNRSLQGLSVKDTTITILDDNGKKLTTESGDMLFTHFGLSGPAALRCSHYVSTAKRQHSGAKLVAEVDCLPIVSMDEWTGTLQQVKKREARKQLSTILLGFLPERLVDVILAKTKVPSTEQMANIKNTDINKIVQATKAFPVPISGTLPLEQATVTGGGVSVKEIDPKTMQSKRCMGLFFAGEVMDVHAHTGGYNITVAFSSGHLAGSSAAIQALQPSLPE